MKIYLLIVSSLFIHSTIFNLREVNKHENPKIKATAAVISAIMATSGIVLWRDLP